MEPEDVTFQFLQEITDGFSENRKLGSGSFGVVYRGVTQNGDDVAVKKLYDSNLEHKQFHNEFNNLVMLKHKNIVQVLGYCYETEQIHMEYNGIHVLAEKTYRALCLEYMHNGSLQNHLSDEFHGLEWPTRYKIIKGVCEGLKYMHKELEEPLYHLDIKPDNILLDKDMVPKIADFGLSKILGEELSRTTQSPLGTIGYQPPEYIERGEISEKFDLFSLGVVTIKILSGPEGYSTHKDMANEEFIDLVKINWRNRLQAKWSGSLFEAYCHQVETCTHIAFNCLEKDSQKRHDIVGIINKLNEIKIDIHKTSQQMDTLDQHQHLNLMKTGSCNDVEFVDTREIVLDVGQEFIVGRTEEIKKVKASLLENMAHKIAILPIYGIGGIGKTTFARLIYNDTIFRTYSPVWVNVSQRFDLNKIHDSIISQLYESKSQINERQMINSCLTELFSGKKILIVLDDLWEDNSFQLEDLKAMLSLGDSINKIILLTTRSERIAHTICTNIKPYKIELLTNDMCWDIIKQRSSFEVRDDKEHLKAIGREIAQKCGGVALAAQSLGFMLKARTCNQWQEVKESEIWNESISQDASLPNHVLASLKLSYISMDLWLRSCFTYCAIFPKGHKIAKEDLVHQWISLGFIGPTKLMSIIQVSEDYIVKLLGLSFLQHSVSPLHTGEYMQNAALFTMHDLVHDLARSVMGNELLDASKTGDTERCNCRYALLSDCSKQLKLFATNPEKLRALHFLHCDKIRIHADAFASAQFLRVLDLSECYIQDLPSSIGQLKHLGYLNAPRVQNQMIPTCIELPKLNYLNLSGSLVIALPFSLCQMKCLMHLNLSCCSKMQGLPRSFALLKNLLHLDLSGCRYVEIMPELLAGFKELVHLDLSNCKCIKSIAEALGGLTNLQFLNLARRKYGKLMNLTGLPEVIINLTKLRYLGLSGTMHSIFGGPSTEKIASFIQYISTLSNLEHLDLSGNYSIACIPESIGSLKKLHTLDLIYCTGLLSLPESMMEMDNLKILNVEGCINLDKSTLPRSNLFVLLPSFVVNANNDESSSNLSLLLDANPIELKISRLENVKSIDEAFGIKLMGKQRMKKLQLEWTRDVQRTVEDIEVLRGLVPPNSLEEFVLQGYKSASFPMWVMGISPHLPNLMEIRMSDLPKCNRLPPLGQLPNLKGLAIGGLHSITKIDEDFYGGARAFPGLKEFQLIGMERLEEWKTTYSYVEDEVKELMFPNLERLTIHDCPKLRLNPCAPRAKICDIENCDNAILSCGQTCDCSSASLTDVIVWVNSKMVPLHQCLPVLKKLCIKHCSDLNNSGEIIRDLSALESLTLESNNQLELPKWFGELVSLKELEISMWPNLNNLHNMQYLISLQKLNLYLCDSILALPEWLGDFITLKKLSITRCSGIKTLPQSIHKLTKLETLSISFCPVLERWCDLEENKMKLSHIMRKVDEGNFQRVETSLGVAATCWSIWLIGMTRFLKRKQIYLEVIFAIICGIHTRSILQKQALHNLVVVDM